MKTSLRLVSRMEKSARIAAATAAFILVASPSGAQSTFTQHNLVSDIPGLAEHTDPNLANPWGIATSGTGPFWISDNHTGLSTPFNTSGTPSVW